MSFFFHKLFCLLENVIIPVFMISGKEDISDCRNCSNICVYLLLYIQKKKKTFQRQSKKAGREFSFGKGMRNVVGAVFVCLFSFCFYGSFMKLFYCHTQQQILKKKNVHCRQYLLNKFLEKYNTRKK